MALSLLIKLLSLIAFIIVEINAARSGTGRLDIDTQFRLRTTISIGTPPQSFSIGLNLETTDFWLIAANATIDESQIGQKKQRYNDTASQTSQLLAGSSFNFSSGGNGVVERDNISIVGVEQAKMKFGVAMSGVPSEMLVDNSYFGNPPYDVSGIFGLSPLQNSVDGIGSSPLKQLTSAVAAPIVSLYTATASYDRWSSGNNFDGTFTLGGIDNKCSGCHFVPLASAKGVRGKWAVNVLKVQVGNFSKDLSKNNQTLKVSDRMQSLRIPTNEFAAVLSALKAKQVFSGSGYFFPTALRASQPDIVLTIGDKVGGKTARLVIPGKQYTEPHSFGWASDYDGMDMLRVAPNSSPDDNIWYFSFDFWMGRCMAVNWVNQTIAFCTASKN